MELSRFIFNYNKFMLSTNYIINFDYSFKFLEIFPPLAMFSEKGTIRKIQLG
jgi:hypothetical protein